MHPGENIFVPSAGRLDDDNVAVSPDVGNDMPGAASKHGAVLSETLLQDLHADRVGPQVLRMGEGVTLAVGTIGKPIFYSVLRGTLSIAMDGEDKIDLRAGENALLFYGDGHRLGSGSQELRLEQPPMGPGAQVEHVLVGGDREQCLVLRCTVELIYLGKTSYAIRALPKLVLQRRRLRIGEIWDTPPFRYLPKQVLEGVEGPWGIAFATAFTNLQLCKIYTRGASSLWRDAQRDARDPNTRRVAAVIREIRAHPDRPWTVASMARHCGLSRSALAAAFTASTGEAPIAYLTRERMERAAKLLRNKTLSMHEIGQRVGYPIESSFARAFRRHWGTAPRRYEGEAMGTEHS